MTNPKALKKASSKKASSKKKRVTVKASKNNVIVQHARGKVVRQQATIVNVKLPTANVAGAVSKMNPYVYSMVLPSQAPITFPSAVVNRVSGVAHMVSSMTQTVAQASAMPTPAPVTASASTSIPLGDNPLFSPLKGDIDSAMMTPRMLPQKGDGASGSRIPHLPEGVPVTRTNNKQAHQQAFAAFNLRYKGPNSSDAAKTRLVEIAAGLLKDTNDLDLMKAHNADKSGGYYQRLHTAMQRALHGP